MSKLIDSKVSRVHWIYLLIAFLGVNFSLSAQTERKISIEYKKEPLSSALVKLQRATDYKVLFTYEDVQGIEVTVSEKNKTVREIMPLLLENTTLTFKIEGKYITVVPTKEKSKVSVQKEIKGKVTDEMNQPLPGAAVYIAGSQIGTVTDFNGNFTLMVPDENSFLEFSFIGMVTETVSAGKKDVINVTLKESAQMLNEEMKKSMDELVLKWESIQVGNPSPDFKATDINGKEYSLADFKGKYVYIDVWASWCGPCKKEAPYLKELEDLYKEKDIYIVSLSCDSDRDAWEKQVKEENKEGVQIILEPNSTFLEDYMIIGIPHFLMLDSEGKIINSEMSRPSNPETKVYLDSLLN